MSTLSSINTELSNPISFLNQNFKNQEVYFVPLPGNAGDSIIGCGTYDAFQSANIHYNECFYPNLPPANSIVIFGGGGGMCSHYNEVFSYLTQGMNIWKHLIILPSTASSNPDFFKKLGKNVSFFARDLSSYKHLVANCNEANLFLSHDMAFNLDLDNILKKHDRPANFLSWIQSKSNNSLRTWLKRRKPLMRLNSIEKFIEKSEKINLKIELLNAFRTDKESTCSILPKGNRDISALLAFGVLREKKHYYYSSSLFMRYLNIYENIRTDRLHVAIGGALLGKQVDFYDNTYSKCKAIYDFSIKNKFPNVTWKGIRH